MKRRVSGGKGGLSAQNAKKSGRRGLPDFFWRGIFSGGDPRPRRGENDFQLWNKNQISRKKSIIKCRLSFCAPAGGRDKKGRGCYPRAGRKREFPAALFGKDFRGAASIGKVRKRTVILGKEIVIFQIAGFPCVLGSIRIYWKQAGSVLTKPCLIIGNVPDSQTRARFETLAASRRDPPVPVRGLP